MKRPILVPKDDDAGPVPKRNAGGGPIGPNIIRALDLGSGRDLYRHPKYQIPELRITDCPEDYYLRGYPYLATRLQDGKTTVVACFKNYGQAAHWIAFILGESNDF